MYGISASRAGKALVRAAALLAALAATPAPAQSPNQAQLPPGFELEVVQEGLNFPGALAFAPDGRLFYTELKSGRVRVIEGGAVLPDAVLELENVGEEQNQGLLGLALDPQFAANGRFYVYYTEKSTEAPVEVLPTWRSIQDNLFTPNCAVCHGGPFEPSAGLNLDEDHSYASLVNKKSRQKPSETFVIPGNPNASYLVKKLEGAPGILGVTMPPGGSIPQTTIDAVRAWIDAGAEPEEDDAPPAAAAKNGGHPARNRVLRYTLSGGVATDPTVLLDDIPAGIHHNGGPLSFAPDGTLFVETGDASVPFLAANRNSLGGKMLRINPDGTVPANNPYPGNPLFSYGHRNTFGMIADPWYAGSPPRAYASENGPDLHDEINLIESNGDYGWHYVSGIHGDPRFVDPIYEWFLTVGPTGIARYTADAFPSDYRGDLIVGHFNTYDNDLLKIQRAELDAAGRKVTGIRPFVTAPFGGVDFGGFVLAVVQGPEGAVYFTTASTLYRVVYPDADDDGCATSIDPAPGAASADADGDGWGADCDCGDGDPLVNPEGAEHCSNGVDDD
ncbi:MAG: PQQ-dependent sugar dehydrogenase, partial [Candidatus Methylomirabilis sp.]|nr:PQQ-dependent sugar dehydrogenase [Deltaproteobacteria bacterium]